MWSEFLFLPPLFLRVAAGVEVLSTPFTHRPLGLECCVLSVCEVGGEEVFGVFSLTRGMSVVLSEALGWPLLTLEGGEGVGEVKFLV